MAAILRLKRFWFVLLAPAAFGLTLLSAANPEATERVYSTGIYPKLAGFIGRIFGLLPFSAAQWIVIILPVPLVLYIAVMIRKIVKDKACRTANAAKLSATLLCAIGVVWFGFTAFCGLNYNRQSFAESGGLEVRPSSAEELELLCDELAGLANTYAMKTGRYPDGTMAPSFSSYREAALRASEAYGLIGEKYESLSGYCPKPKPVFFSRAMSAINIVGIYFPFTFEANVNVDVPYYLIPSSMMHELAHFKGFMREDEANFISYAACVSSGNDDFIYSGLMLALTHSIGELYSTDRDAYWRVTDSLIEPVRDDFKANSEYWKQFEGPISEASEKVNDVYLKTNRQAAGVKSYGRMVDLLLAERRTAE